jgi:2-polyprenyl-3-methyl-5-hydroxy-6-metoxy-1,4-benzoquinol methylase
LEKIPQSAAPGKEIMTQQREYLNVGRRDARLSGWFAEQANEIFKGLPISSDDVVLDVGCGNGVIADFCAARGAAIIVTDSDPAKISAVQSRLENSAARSVQALVSDSNPLPVPDNIASVVISTEVLEHVDDTSTFLAELVRVGRPGARYLLAVPDPVAETLQKSVAPQSYFEKPNHVRIVGRDEFAEMISAAGLVIERRTTYGFYSSLWWLMLWLSPDTEARENVQALWSQTWDALLDTPNGMLLKNALDSFMPKSQLIIARKP